MFWGLVVEPGKVYVNTIENDVQLANVVVIGKVGERSTLFLEIENVRYALCTLEPGKSDNYALNIVLPEGEEVSFSAVGKGTFHVTGFEIITQAEEGEDLYDEDLLDEDEAELEDEEDEDEEADDLNGFIVAENDDEEGDEEEGEDEDEEDEEDEDDEAEEQARIEAEKAAKQAAEKAAKEAALAKAKANKEKKEAKRKRAAEEADVKAAKAAKADKPQPSFKTLSRGVKIVDVKVGSGNPVSKGHKCTMRYQGRLVSNRKMFDQGSISFKLGAGEVIAGWDIGVAGMKKGGKRRIVIPAKAGYGKRGAPPDIPPNADLEFDVQLLK